MTYTERREALLANPAVTFRLKRIIAELDRADPVKALHEVILLERLARQRLDEIELGPLKAPF